MDEVVMGSTNGIDGLITLNSVNATIIPCSGLEKDRLEYKINLTLINSIDISKKRAYKCTTLSSVRIKFWRRYFKEKRMDCVSK